MLIIGIILALIGYFCVIPVLETIGLILAAVGLLLLVFGAVGGHPVAGRRYWW